jgi:hypothetical protein
MWKKASMSLIQVLCSSYHHEGLFSDEVDRLSSTFGVFFQGFITAMGWPAEKRVMLLIADVIYPMTIDNAISDVESSL